MSAGYELLVVGGGPAGFSAARAFRAVSADAAVAIITDERHMPYQRPPLTKEVLRGERTLDALALEDEQWLEEHDVDLVAGRAVRLDPQARVVGLSGGRELSYSHCVLATGAEPSVLPVPGADRPWVHVVRAIDHVQALARRLTDGARVAVIGSGFIGCEIASSLRLRGHAVALVSDEAGPNTGRLGPGAAALLAAWLAQDGVELHLGHAVQRIDTGPDGAATIVTDASGVAADVIVMAVGVRPRAELAHAAGLALDDGAVPVDAALRTRQAGLFAAGDVCKADNTTAGRALRVEHWGDALTQGEIAGRNAAGAQDRWDSVPGFWSTIGRRTLKYAAWGDGFDAARVEQHAGGGFTVWYGRDGSLVGVLTHEADRDYEAGSGLIAAGAPWSG